MPLMLYQIGDFPVFNYTATTSLQDNEVKFDSSWRVPDSVLTQVSGKFSHLETQRPLSDAATYNVKGTLQAKDSHTLEQLASFISSLGGRANIPIIAFYYEEFLDDLSKNCACDSYSVTWLISRGVVRSSGTRTLSTNESWSWAGEELSIEITQYTPWKILSGWQWEYRPFNQRVTTLGSLTIPFSPDNYFRHPETVKDMIFDNYFFNYAEDSWDNDPNYWEVAYQNPYWGGVGSGFSRISDFVIYVDPVYWSSPPLSRFAFKNLDSSGTLSLAITGTEGSYSTVSVTRTATLDLGSVNTLLANYGYGGLYPSDILFTGAVDPLPGYVQRNGTILNVALNWEYDSLYPGEMFLGANKVSILGTNTDVLTAYKIDYMRV